MGCFQFGAIKTKAVKLAFREINFFCLKELSVSIIKMYFVNYMVSFHLDKYTGVE